MEDDLDKLKRNFEEETGQDIDELMEQAVDKLANLAQEYDGENGNDAIARAIIGSLRPLMQALRNDDVTPLMFGIGARHFIATGQSLHILQELADFRNDSR